MERSDLVTKGQASKLPVAVVIPCFKVKRHITGVLAGIVGLAEQIYVVDDCCPEATGRFVEGSCSDPSVKVLYHDSNQGVGGAVMTGYRQALSDGHQVVVKMDGDGQMDPNYLSSLVAPLLSGAADYAKGNRFFDIYSLKSMPSVRLIGNASLSFIMKAASGYWEIMDPTNGYTALHRAALERLPLDRLDPRYFFECDMLFRLSTIRAVVQDVPMPAIYGDETSSLKVGRVLLDFPVRFLTRIIKRFFYMYILRDFNIGSIEALAGLAMLVFGTVFGVWHWVESAYTGKLTSTGTVMIAVLPVILGVQFLLSAVGYDIANRPSAPLQRLSASTDHPP